MAEEHPSHCPPEEAGLRPRSAQVTAPLRSRRWALFFVVCSALFFALGIDVEFVEPSRLIDQARQLCDAERARTRSLPLRPGSPWSTALPNGACGSLAELERTQADGMHRLGSLAQGTLPISLALLFLAKRLRGSTALEALHRDRRAPVLYLRSFQADEADRLRSSGYKPTTESALVDELGRVGPVLAIGRPGDKLPPLGAARLEVSNDEWQPVAERLLHAAHLIVFRACAATPGLAWELGRARSTLPHNRVALWFPAGLPPADAASFRDLVRTAMNVELPMAAATGFVTFEAGWQPLAPVARLPSEVPKDDADQSTLLEFLETLELKVVRPPPFRPYPIAWIVIAIGLVALLVVPGERGALAPSPLSDSDSRPLAAAVEGLMILVIALGVAFLAYFKRPAWRWLTTLILVGAIAANGVTVSQRYADLQTSRATFAGTIGALCRRTNSCAAPAEADRLTHVCQDSFDGPSDTGPRQLKLLAQTLSDTLAQCPTLACESLATCFRVNFKLNTMDDGLRSLLFQRTCDVVLAEGLTESDSSKRELDRATQALNDAIDLLGDPDVAAALVKPARQMCRSFYFPRTPEPGPTK